MEYLINAKKVCRECFCAAHDISKYSITNIIQRLKADKDEINNTRDGENDSVKNNHHK